jgi:negative regulator of sigma E activity
MTSERDAQLSALLDGALAAAEETALREELAREPALAARLAQLAQVDAALRALPARPVPADLRSRLQAKLDAEPAVRPALARSRGSAPARPRRRAWLAGASVAVAAAAAALVVLVMAPGEPRGDLAADSAERATEPAPGALPRQEAPRVAASETAPARAEDSLAAPPHVDEVPSPARVASAAETTAASDSLAPENPQAADALGSQEIVATASRSPTAAPVAGAEIVMPSPTVELAAADSPAPLWVEATDAEAAALALLEPHDAGVVAVLEWLGELDALEAEAS